MGIYLVYICGLIFGVYICEGIVYNLMFMLVYL